jgi:hypothetical protein
MNSFLKLTTYSQFVNIDGRRFAAIVEVEI